MIHQEQIRQENDKIFKKHNIDKSIITKQEVINLKDKFTNNILDSFKSQYHTYGLFTKCQINDTILLISKIEVDAINNNDYYKFWFRKLQYFINKV